MRLRYHLLHLRVLMGLCLLTPAAWSFSISPGVQVITASPQQSQDVPFEIINDQSEPLTVTCSVRDSFVLPENSSHHAEEWVKFKGENVVVPGKSTKTGKLSVTVPSDASGELAAFISFAPVFKEAKDKKPGTETRVVTLITSSLYVRVAGTVKGKADLGEIRVENLPVRGPAPAAVKASVIVKNSGNVHQRPWGEFKVFKRGAHEPSYSGSFRSGWPVMPYSDGAYDVEMPGQLPAGRYEVQTKISFTPDVSIEKKARFEIDKEGKAKNFKDL